MNRRLFLSHALAASAATCLVPAAAPAQDPTDELIETADGVKLRGIFYKAQKSKNNSCVLIVQEPFADSNDKADRNWDGLAKKLAGEGFHTLRFDFRGRPKSKEVIPEKFWSEQLNTTLPGADKSVKKKVLLESDYRSKTKYFPQLIYDLAAARNHLDKLNDDGQVNTSSVYLVGAGDAATLGLMFLATEWHREQKKPAPMGIAGVQKLVINANYRIAAGSSPAGRDYGGCVWLTPKLMAGFTKDEAERWATYNGRSADGDMRKETPMLFVTGEKDSKGLGDVKTFNEKILITQGSGAKSLDKIEDLVFTKEGVIKETPLRGSALLGLDDTLKTETLIVKFFKAMEEKRRSKTRIQREYTQPIPINLASFGG